MLTQSRMNHTKVKQDLRCVCNLIEEPYGFFKLLMIIAVQGGNPRFDFLAVISMEYHAMHPYFASPVSMTSCQYPIQEQHAMAS